MGSRLAHPRGRSAIGDSHSCVPSTMSIATGHPIASAPASRHLSSTWLSSRPSLPPRSTTSASTSPSTTSAHSIPLVSPLPHLRTTRQPTAPPCRFFAKSNHTPLLSLFRNPDPIWRPPPVLSSLRWCPRASQLLLHLHPCFCATFSPALLEGTHTPLMFQTWSPRVFSLTMTTTKTMLM